MLFAWCAQCQTWTWQRVVSTTSTRPPVQCQGCQTLWLRDVVRE